MNILSKDFNAAVDLLKNREENDLALFVLRHGQSLGQLNIDAYKTIGDDKLPLTKLGTQQAVASGGIISAIADQMGFSKIRIITSTGQRSTRTAVEAFAALNPEQMPSLSYDTRLDKQKFGRFDGLFTSEERRVKCPEDYKIYAAQLKADGLFHTRPPGGESINDVQNRVTALINDLKGTHMPTVLVTHGTNALCLENALLNHGQEWVLNGIDTWPNCGIRLLAGNGRDSYTAHTVSNDPVYDVKLIRRWQKEDGMRLAM